MRKILKTLIGGLSLLLISNIGSVAMALSNVERIDFIKKYAKIKKFSPEFTAGLLGNIRREVGPTFSPFETNRDEGSYGLFQYYDAPANKGRIDAFLKYMKDKWGGNPKRFFKIKPPKLSDEKEKKLIKDQLDFAFYHDPDKWRAPLIALSKSSDLEKIKKAFAIFERFEGYNKPENEQYKKHHKFIDEFYKSKKDKPVEREVIKEEVIEKPVSPEKKSFDQTFREARASGLREFMWTNNNPKSKLFGKTYPVLTRLAGESEEEWSIKFPSPQIEEKEEKRIVETEKVQPDPQQVPEEIKKEEIDESVFELKKSPFEAPPSPEIPPEQTPLDVPKPYGVYAKETPEYQEAGEEQLWAGKHGGEVKKYQIGGEAVAGETVVKEEEVDMNWEETDLPPYDFDSAIKQKATSKPLTPEELGKKPEEEPKSFDEQEMETKKMGELKSFFDSGQTDILWQYNADELQDLRDKHVGVGSSDRDKLNDLIVKKKDYEEKLGSYAPGEGRQGSVAPGSFTFESKTTESEDIQPKKGQYHKGVFYPAYEEKGGEFRGKGVSASWEDPTPTKGVPRLPPQEIPKPAPRVMPSKSPQEQKQEKDEFQVEQERLNSLQQQKMTDLENTLRATDPNRYWNNLGTAGKINAGLAMIFGLASPDGRNAGVEAIKKSIDDDIGQQKLEHDVEIAKKKIALETVTKKIDNMMKFRKDQTLNVKTKLESDKLKAEIAKLDMEGKAEARLNTKRALVMAGKIPFDSLSYAEKTAMLGKKGMDQFSDLYTKYNKSSEKVQIGLALNTLGSIREYARMQDGIGDTAILFRVLKLLDPNSVVREGEFANAQKSGVSGVEQIKRVYDRLITPGGPSLTPDQRDRWLRVAMTQATQIKNQHDVINRRFDKHAKALGLPTVTTTYNLFEQDPVARKRYKMFVKIKKANPQFRNKEILDAMKRKGIPLL